MSRLSSFVLTSLAFLVVSGCGSKTQLWTPPPTDSTNLDGGFDGGFIDGGSDGGTDAGVPIEVDCGRSEQFTTPRRESVLEAVVTSSRPIMREGWTLVDAPMGSSATNAPTEGPSTALTPDLLGTYLLRFEAIDSMGNAGSCEVRVQAVVGPPVALCPEATELRTGISEPLTIYGDAFDDEGVVSVGWTQVAGPTMARLRVVGGNGAIIEMIADLGGRYELELRAVDADGAMDTCRITVVVTAPPTVVCPSAPVRAPTRQPVTITAMAMDDIAVTRTTWELIARPMASTTSISPTTGLSTTMTPDRQGDYFLRFTAFDEAGLSASCEVHVIGTPTPPSAMCPAVVETSPLTPTEITGSAVDDGTITRWAWRVTNVPPGSRPDEPTPSDSPRTVFTPDLAGEYTLRLTVTDDDGEVGECETLVRAISSDGLRVEISWDTNNTDMDTHLLHPDARAWFDSTLDCYYANTNPSWGGPGVDDDPRLDIDDTDGFGPENINIRNPGLGTYRVGVHAFSGFARVTVRIYCGGSTTTPRQTFGPVAIDGRNVWRVADVDITPAGCTIRSLAAGPRPNIISEMQSRAAR